MNLEEATAKALTGESVENNFSKYRAVRIVDASETGVDYGIIMLNNKHSVKDFQKAMNDAYERNKEDILEYGDDLAVVLGDIDPSFDWFEFEEDDEYLTI